MAGSIKKKNQPANQQDSKKSKKAISIRLLEPRRLSFQAVEREKLRESIFLLLIIIIFYSIILFPFLDLFRILFFFCIGDLVLVSSGSQSVRKDERLLVPFGWAEKHKQFISVAELKDLCDTVA